MRGGAGVDARNGKERNMSQRWRVVMRIGICTACLPCCGPGGDAGPGTPDTDAAELLPDAPGAIVDAAIPDDEDARVVADCGADSPRFVFNGEVQHFTVPAGALLVQIKAWGAGGAAGHYAAGAPGTGGGGAFVDLVAHVGDEIVAGEDLEVLPGEGGRVPGGGGGASYVQHANGIPIVIAGGGGGGGSDGGLPEGQAVMPSGGAGGGDAGEAGVGQGLAPWGAVTGGTGGSLTAGGVGGVSVVTAGTGHPCPGGDGAEDEGGMAGAGWEACEALDTAQLDRGGLGGSNGGAGSGGAGYWGGGGGGSLSTYFGGGGGGGSSYHAGGTAEGGVGQQPGNTADPMYDGNAGRGGLGGLWPDIPSEPGAGGLIVMCAVQAVP